MNLSALLQSLNTLKQTPEYVVESVVSKEEMGSIVIDGIRSDSRLVLKNELFGVFVSSPEYALRYIHQALNNGVKVFIVLPQVFEYLKHTPFYSKMVCLVTENPRQLFAHAVAAFYQHTPLNCVAVTGTAGKTSVASLVLQLWQHLQLKAASIGTLGLNHTLKNLLVEYNSGLTTPDAVAIHKCLSELKANGIDHVIMEASSHGLDQSRLDGIGFKVAAFTNFSQDHLDYHKTMEAYFEAKLRLFQNLISSNGWAVLNADIPEYDALLNVCESKKHPVLSYGVNGTYVVLKHTQLHSNGQEIQLVIKGEPHTVIFPLIGRTQLYNLMCALTIVLSLNAPLDEVLSGVAAITPIPGRLNFAGQHPNGANIYVDYAHKPEALQQILKDIRPYTKGKLHLVFGCGGDRDTGKRPKMGAIAAKYADVITVTDDNPRTENAANIRHSILETCPNAIEIGDRRKAIEHAVEALSSDDVLVIAGKGHEKHQIIGHQKIPLDDFEIISSTLEKLS